MAVVSRARKITGLHYAAILQKIKKKLKFKFKFIKKNKIFNVDVNESIIEEVVGNLSSGAFIGFFAVVGGSVALFAHPVVGTIILFFSIVYGSVVKVFAGKCYRKKYAVKDDINKELVSLLKTKKHSIPCIRTDTSKYTFVRVLSPLANKTIAMFSPTNKSLKRYGVLPPIKSNKVVPF